jgi:acyl carrier protein
MAARCDSADPLRQVREVAPRRLSLMFASGRKDWEDQSDRNCQRCQNRYCRRGDEGYRVPSPCRSTELTEDAKLTDPGADSIDLYEVIMSLEEKFGITIDAGDAQRFVAVGDAIAFVKGEVDRF